MFFVLIFGSLWGKTVSLSSDSFDNLGDAITYAVSIWAVGKGTLQKARDCLTIPWCPLLRTDLTLFGVL